MQVSKTCCLTFTETTRLIRNGKKVCVCVGGGGGKRDYTMYVYVVASNEVTLKTGDLLYCVHRTFVCRQRFWNIQLLSVIYRYSVSYKARQKRLFNYSYNEHTSFSHTYSPWYNRKDWLGVKHQITVTRLHINTADSSRELLFWLSNWTGPTQDQGQRMFCWS